MNMLESQLTGMDIPCPVNPAPMTLPGAQQLKLAIKTMSGKRRMWQMLQPAVARQACQASFI
ncbi:MAG: hypothetical protein ABW095_02315 [Candidatus Thiodiazotropha sp.]